MAGSSSASLTRSSSAPLTGGGSELLTGARTGEKKRLMIAVSQTNMGDGYPQISYSSKVAFDWAMENIIGTSYDRYKIFLIHVEVPQTWTGIRYCISPFRSSAADESLDDHRKKVREFMDIFERQCRNNNIEYESLLRMGCPEKVICGEVKNVKPELLVLGNRCLGAFQRLFRANVSEYCAKYAECQVMRIKRPPEILRTLKAIHND